MPLSLIRRAYTARDPLPYRPGRGPPLASWLEGPAEEERDAGHVTRATRLFGVYRPWAQQHHPEGPPGDTAFIRAGDRAAPIEARVMLMIERAPPQLAFQGTVLTVKRTGA